MQTLTTTFVPGPHRPLLHNPHPHWDYAAALKSVYANFPVHCKLLQSRGGYSSALGAAYEWLRDCKSSNGGLQYFLDKGGCETALEVTHQNALLDQIVALRNDKEELTAEVDEVKKKYVAEVEGLKRGHQRELDEVNRVKDEQVNERTKIEQQRNAIQRKLTEARSEVERVRGSRNLDQEKREKTISANPQAFQGGGEDSQKGLQREGTRASLKRRRKEGAQKGKTEVRGSEGNMGESKAEGAEKRPERKEADNGPSAEPQQ
ncbi:hypothetical protein KFL_012150010, partial [Klebsormidium nitens]